MTNSVTFSASVGGDNSTVTDDADPTTGLAAGGHRTRFVPALAQLVAVALFTVAKAAAAAASAASAVNAPGTSATTTSSVTVGTGSKTFTLAQTGKAFAVGQTVVCASAANANNSITGPITAFNSGTGVMTINATTSSGSGTFSDGSVALQATGGIPATRQISAGGLASGGGDLSADRTITVTATAAADVRGWADTTKAMTTGSTASALAEVALTDGASIFTSGDASLVMAKFINASVTLGGNRTLPNPSDIASNVGKSGRIRVAQDGTGNRTLVFGSFWKRQGGAPTLSTAAGANDFIVFDVVSATLILYDLIRNPS